MTDFKKNLVESADAAARVGVLFVAVALFAAMWESDSPPTRQTDHWLARRAGISGTVTRTDHRTIVPAPRRDSIQVDKPASRQTVSRQTVSTPIGDAHVTEAAWPYPLPAGIVPGQYRVVDSFGEVSTLHVSDGMVSSNHMTPDCHQLIVEDGHRTVYFIRLRRAATARAGRTIDRQVIRR